GYGETILVNRVQMAPPWVLSTRLRPDFIRIYGIPTRHVAPIEHRHYRGFTCWPSFHQFSQKISAYLPVTPAYPIYGTTAPNGQMGHIKLLGWILRIYATKWQKVMNIQISILFGIVAKILPHYGRSELIKACRHSGMGSDQITCTCNCQ